MGLKLSLSFKLQLPLVLFGQCAVGAKWTEGKQATGQAELLKGPNTRGPRIPLGNISPLLRGRVKSLMLWHTHLLWRLNV